MLPPAEEINFVPDLSQILEGTLKIPLKIPVLGPVSTRENPDDANPPCCIPSIVHL